MKFFIVFTFALFVGALALTDEQKAKLKAHKDACIAETGADPILIENAKNGNIAEGDEKLACFASCILQKIGFLNAEGNINEDVFRSKIPQDIPKEQVDEVLEKCKNIGGAKDCENGFKLMKCLLQNKKFTLLN